YEDIFVVIFQMLFLSQFNTLSPYTTLFRSPVKKSGIFNMNIKTLKFVLICIIITGRGQGDMKIKHTRPFKVRRWMMRLKYGKCEIEEHTSELQSRFDLVCRLLLEKQNSTHA